MPDKVLTASPEDPEPIVTPKPVLFKQFDPALGKTLLRPSMVIDNGAPRDRTAEEQLQLAPEKANGDRWGASGCHPTSVAMIVEWFRRHPTLGTDLKLPFPPDEKDVPKSGPAYVWKWICDPSGTPGAEYTASAHPPWTPHHRENSGDNAWSVKHGDVGAAPTKITRKGVKLSLSTKAWTKRSADGAADLKARADRKKTLKQMLHKCGPLAINMTYPGHYVLLYGYRGDYLYILDPGAVIAKWAQLHPDWPVDVTETKDKKTGKVTKKETKRPAANYKLVDSATSRMVAQFFSNACDLLIDGEFEFPNIPLKKDKAGNVIARGPIAFLDTLINYEGYYFLGAPTFDEFLTAPAPGGDGAVITPLPPPPAGGTGGNGSTPSPATPASEGQTGGAASSPGTTPGSATPNSSPGAAGSAAPTAGGVFSDLWDILLYPISAASRAAGGILGGGSSNSGTSSNGSAGATPAGPAPRAEQVRASVTVIDDETDKPVAGVEVEIVGIDKGKTDAAGKWASRTFDAGAYNLKARKAGYGPGGSDRASSEGETAQSVNLSSNQALTVRMRNVNLARGFIWVLEERSRRPLSGMGTEIVGIDAGRTNDRGQWISKSFAPNKKWVKTRAPGWGPATGGVVVEGETAQQVDFGKGDKSLVVYMAQSNPLSIPAPSDCKQDVSQLKVSGPAEVDAASFSKSNQPVTFQAAPIPGGVHPLSKWTVYDPSGNAADDNLEPFGSTYDLAPGVVQACIAKRGNEAYGRWNVRFERGDYYHDCPFVLVGPMPDVGIASKGAQETPSQPDLGPVPEGFVADGLNADKITKVNSVDMAHAYADALRQSGAAPSRKTVLLLTAHWHFETGGGKSMHWYNLGNVKYVDANGKVAYTSFRCDEWLNESQVEALIKKTPAEQYEVTDKTRTDKKGNVTTRVFLIPPHPGTRFRAYPNLSAGLASHLKIIRGKKFGKAFDAAVAENIDDFVHQLKLAGYFTDSEEVYKKGVHARYTQLDKLITDLVT